MAVLSPGGGAPSFDVMAWLSRIPGFMASQSIACIKYMNDMVAIAKLPPEDAQLIVLCYLEGYSYDELAEQFQVERGTVGSRLHRIRAVLQKHLSK